MQHKKIRVCWMYHNIMDLYGDKGNMMVLSKRCENRGIACEIVPLDIGQEMDLTSFDLLFLGGGADREQVLLMEDLLKRKQQIAKAMEQGTFVVLICGGYQLFGQYYIAADGTKIEGLKFFDYYTEAGSNYQRCIGNIAVFAQLDDITTTVIGFENHGGQTRNVRTPFGKVLSGYGNNQSDHMEGFYNGQVLGTYLHGPLFPKNPEVADFVIYKCLKKQNPDLKYTDLTKLDDSLEQQAREVMLKRMNLTV